MFWTTVILRYEGSRLNCCCKLLCMYYKASQRMQLLSFIVHFAPA